MILTQEELDFARQVGINRNKYAKANGFKNRHGIPVSKELEYDIVGAIGEYVLCRYLNIEWDHESNLYGKHDVAGYEVRTASGHRLKLIVRPDDDSDSIFVLVTVEGNTGRIHGWLYGHEAKQVKWLEAPNDRPAAYFVPRFSLNSMSNLPGIERFHGSKQAV